MDYEKKYNEALNWMRELYPGLHGATKEDAEHYFPELRESEDERIRKYLVEELKAAKSVGELKFTIPQPTREECIAYLEKQKEQKPKNILTDDDSLQTAYLKGQTDVLEDPEAYGLQKEQKPAEWSEDDEEMLNSCISSIEESKENRYAYKETDGDTSYDREVDWLKSLRPSWKPSEEQIDALKELIDDANRAGWVTPGATELYEQLKKL